MIANKEIMAKNIKKYLAERGVKAIDVCRALGIKQNTFSDWENGKIYPRIDKIEMLANYFGISKSDLVEDKSEIEILTDDEKIVLELYRTDPEFQQLLRLSKYYELIAGGKHED
jgi:transcriptional regulator with XRE-family HTH domain